MVQYVVSASSADANHDRLSQRAPIARNGQARTNVPVTPVRGAIEAPATTILRNNQRRPRRGRPVQLRAEPRLAARAATTALKSP
jgi:hypothetical protein